MSDTHVNAYKMELQDAEIALTQAQSRVDSLKKTISAMEPEEPKESFGEKMARIKAEKAAEVPETPVTPVPGEVVEPEVANV